MAISSSIFLSKKCELLKYWVCARIGVQKTSVGEAPAKVSGHTENLYVNLSLNGIRLLDQFNYKETNISSGTFEDKVVKIFEVVPD